MSRPPKIDEAVRTFHKALALIESAADEIAADARDAQMWRWAQLPPVYVPPVGDIGLTRDSYIATNGYVLFVRGKLP